MSIDYDKQFHTLHSDNSCDESSYLSSPKHHLHKQNANNSFQWFATDQPERFNMQSSYKENSIDYKFNSDGYRCEELAPAPFLFTGCSYSFGVGLKSEETWPALLANKLGVTNMNVSYPGASIQYIQRTLLKTIPLVKPKCVVALIPYNYRFEFVSSGADRALKVWTASGVRNGVFKGEDKERLYGYELFTRSENEDFLLASGLYFIQSYLQALGIKFIFSLWTYENEISDYFENISAPILDKNYLKTDIFNNHYRWKDLSKKARDSSHPAAQYHQHYSDFLIEGLKCLNTESP